MTEPRLKFPVASAYSLAKIFQTGDSVESDQVQAHAWAAQSEANEHPEGSLLKNEIAESMSAEEIGRARRLFAAWQIE